jgi:hypothetical protein
MDNGSTGVPAFEMPQNPNTTNTNGNMMMPQGPNFAQQPAVPEALPQTAGNHPGASNMPPMQPPMQPPQMAQYAAQPPRMHPPMAQPPHTGSPISAHLTAEDAELIEKAWVDKAKEIVERTRHDPYIQNREITKMKADYMKKRYNKDIRIPED